jgi:hypothetical protein
MAVVQHLAGHKDAATTARYDRRDEAARQQAADLVHMPYFPRNAGKRS